MICPFMSRPVFQPDLMNNQGNYSLPGPYLYEVHCMKGDCMAWNSKANFELETGCRLLDEKTMHTAE